MERMELRAKLNESRSETIIELWMEGEPLGHINLPAAELEGFIHQLARHRRRMAEEVPHDLDPGARLEAEVDPVWRWPKKWSGGGAEGKMLVLRYPGFGWLAFVFPE